jgi:hypothetical protein
MADCVQSRDESIDTPLDPPLFWLDNILIFNISILDFYSKEPFKLNPENSDDTINMFRTNTVIK